MSRAQSTPPSGSEGFTASVASRSEMRSHFVNEYLVRRRRTRRVIAVMVFVLLAAYVGHSLVRVAPWLA
jgi:hypothetical protein